MELICIVVPTYKEFNKLNNNEIISWRQCLKILRSYTICLAYPSNLNIYEYIHELKANKINYQLQQFKPQCFESIDRYNQLMLSKSFFQRFISYKYILTYQLDAYIFKDDLAYWCEADYSYIGAPWFEEFGSDYSNTTLWRVGNGGFTLRKVASCLRVLNTFSSIWTWSEVIKWYFQYGRRQGLESSLKIIRRLLLGNNTYWILNDFYLLREKFQEDYFWGVICSEKFDWYKVPTPQQALHFSFEVSPGRMYELNNKELPMGCHAWEKYDFNFWKPFILDIG